jgi:PIN domain nuclease of toxin-antitoxin system
MTSYLLDTHVWAWSLLSATTTPNMAQMLSTADALQVSAISLYEIRQKIRLGKRAEMERHSSVLIDLLDRQGVTSIPVDADIGQLAGALDWQHRDPFDRLIAATAIHTELPLVSADEVFDQLASRKDWTGRVW